MSESKIIKVYNEGIQSVVTLVQALSTQISDLSQTVEKQSEMIIDQNKTISDLDARLKKLEKQTNKTSESSSLHPQRMDSKKQKVYVNLQKRNPWDKVVIRGLI